MSFLTYITQHIIVCLFTLAFCETLGLGMLIGQTKNIKNKISKPVFIGGLVFIIIFIALLHLLLMSIFYTIH